MTNASHEIKDPGSGSVEVDRSRRIINKDGSFNVRRRSGKQSVRSTYHYLISIGWGQFLLYVLGWFVAMNFIFACFYYGLGADAIGGVGEESGMTPFGNAFFFSVETFTTVGYGHMYPVGIMAHIISALEALFGLLSIALFTGLLYGRFSRPSAKILFSTEALIAPYQTGKSLQLRLVNMRNNVLLQMEATVLLVLREEASTGGRLKYYELELETNKILFLPLSWTLVHPINKESPLHTLTEEDLIERRAEILVNVKGFDDGFSQFVFQRHSYMPSEIKWGARFIRPFSTAESGHIVLDVTKVGQYEDYTLPD